MLILNMKENKFDKYSEGYVEILDDSLAISGEDSAFFAEYKASYLLKLIKNNFNGAILDYGCGIGMLTRLLRQNLTSAKIYGYDISTESIKKAQSAETEDIFFTTKLNELKKEFDLIIVANVFHHIRPENRQSVISEIKAKLSSSGKLVIFEHNPKNPLTRHIVDHCPFDDDALLLPYNETKQRLKKAGFNDIKGDYILFFPKMFGWLRPIEKYLSWLPIGTQYVQIGKVVE